MILRIPHAPYETTLSSWIIFTSALGSILFAFDAALVPAATPPMTIILFFLLVDNYVYLSKRASIISILYYYYCTHDTLNFSSFPVVFTAFFIPLCTILPFSQTSCSSNGCDGWHVCDNPNQLPDAKGCPNDKGYRG